MIIIYYYYECICTYTYHHTHSYHHMYNNNYYVYRFSCTYVSMLIRLHSLSFLFSLPPPPPPTVVGEPPQFMMPQQANVPVYRNNSLGEPQNLVLNCRLVNATDVTFEWFRFVDNPESAVRVPAQIVNPATGTLTVYSITEGEYASVDGVNYYCIATRFIGSSNYSASVRSRTITVFYACKCSVSRVCV